MVEFRVGIRNLRFITFCILFVSLCSCASISENSKNGNILAIVDGEPVTRGDLEYSLQIAHRREDLSSAKTLDISKYIQKLINDKLIIQEAKRMGLENHPEVQKKVQAYTLRESVVRLYDEEILQKVTVTEEDIINYYRENYERFIMDIIETDTREKASEILEQLKNGGDFKVFSQKYPANLKKQGELYIFQRRSLSPHLREVIDKLQIGEVSDVVEAGNRFFIIKLINKQEAPDEELEGLRSKIEDAIRKQKINDKSDEYLAQLREKATLNINRELLSSINMGGSDEEKNRWLQDDRVLAKVNDEVLTVGEFAAMLPHNTDSSREEILNRWLDRKLVDQEALSRGYDMSTNLKEMINRYRDQIIKNIFISQIIVPKINVSDEEVKEYYLTHQEEFAKPLRYRVQQITVKTMEEAQEILKSLKEGASFSWLAKMKSVDSFAPKGGVVGWRTKDQLPEPVREIIDTLNPGDISSIIKIDSQYRIIMLQDKTEREFEEFRKVQALARRKVFAEKFNKIYEEYINKLRKEAKIEINKKAIESFEQIFQKS
jgi:parvulin-like peptidyl-prolyl isomerase